MKLVDARPAWPKRPTLVDIAKCVPSFRGSSQIAASILRLAPWLRYWRMPNQDLVLDVTDPSQFELLRGEHEYEPETSKLLRSRLAAGRIFIDVGANWGYFSWLGSRQVGPQGLVVAIEPLPSAYRRLIQTIRRNELHNVVPLNLAACDQDGAHVSMVKPWYRQSTAAYMRTSDRQRLLTRRLDSIAAEVASGRSATIAAVKIDVEGAELLVLRGMVGILSRHKPMVIVEAGGYLVRFGHTFDEMQSFLSKYGYHPTLSIEDRGTPLTRPYSCGDERFGQIVFETD